jgi:hypothetical protein
LSRKLSQSKLPPPPHPPCNVGGAPQQPETDQDLNERINEAAGAGDRGTKFEARAAKHNEYGIRRAERNDDGTPTGRSAMSTGDHPDNHVRFTCSVCGRAQPGQIDHLSKDKDGTTSTVEAKNVQNYPGSSDDEILRNNAQLERLVSSCEGNGNSLTFKIPKEVEKTVGKQIAQSVQKLSAEVASRLSIVGV